MSTATRSRHWRFADARSVQPCTLMLRGLYLSQEFLQQGRGIVLLPDHVKSQPYIHINNWQQHNASGAMPAGGFREPRDPDLALDKTQHRVAFCRLLNNVWSVQATARARLHHSVIEGWIDPAMEPDERHVPQIPQANSFSLRQRMAFGLLVPRRDSGGKPHVQSRQGPFCPARTADAPTP